MQQSSPDNIEKLLQNLSSGSFYVRQEAAQTLGNLSYSTNTIIDALITAKENDSHEGVRKAATAALETFTHQAYIKEHPEAVAKAIERIQEGYTQQAQQVFKTQKRNKFLTLIAGIVIVVIFAIAATFLISGFVSAAQEPFLGSWVDKNTVKTGLPSHMSIVKHDDKYYFVWEAVEKVEHEMVLTSKLGGKDSSSTVVYTFRINFRSGAIGIGMYDGNEFIVTEGRDIARYRKAGLFGS